MKSPHLSSYFTADFLNQHLSLPAPVKEISLFNIDNSASILVSLAAQDPQMEVGHFGLSLGLANGEKRKLILKLKPHGSRTSGLLNALAQAGDPAMAELYEKHQLETGFSQVHERESIIYRDLAHPMQPQFYGAFAHREAGHYGLFIEYFGAAQLLNTVMEPNRWLPAQHLQALEAIADWHVYSREAINKGGAPALARDREAAPFTPLSALWAALLAQAKNHYPALYPVEGYRSLQKALNNWSEHQKAEDSYVKTLIHNDFNLRNVCFVQQRFCCYDWELANWSNPSYDLIEFLCFALEAEELPRQFWPYLQAYYRKLCALESDFHQPTAFWDALLANTYRFGLQRLGLYMMAHHVSPYPFIPRLCRSYFSLLQLLEQAKSSQIERILFFDKEGHR